MPMFDFKCEDCKNIFEDLVLPNGDAISCPTCNSLNITKLIGACPALWMTFTPSMTAMSKILDLNNEIKKWKEKH